MYNPQDDKDTSKAWIETANMAKENQGEAFEAWIMAAEKAIKHNNPSYNGNKTEYPATNDIKRVVGALIYNNENTANSTAETLGIEIPKDLQIPSSSVIEEAKNHRYAFGNRIENVIHRNQIAQRRNAIVFADQDFAIFDMDDNFHNEVNNMSETLNGLINSLHQRFNNFIYGDENRENNGFVQREEARQAENANNQRGI